MRFSYDTYAECHSRTYRKLFANKIMCSSSLIILKTSRTNDVRLCEITCNSHNCLRRVVGVNYWKEQFKLLASYEGLHADYVRLCEIM